MNTPPTIKELWNSDSIDRLFASSGIGFIIVGPDQRILDANQTYCDKLGWSLDELRTMAISDLTHPDDLAMTDRLFRHSADRNLVQVHEKRYLTRSGETLWCKLRSEAVNAPDGSWRFRIVMVEDITREKLDEINLEQMAAITEASDDAIFRCGTDERIQFWGKGAERMYGYTAEEAIGQKVTLISAVKNDEALVRARTQLKKGSVVNSPYARARHKDGHFFDVSSLIFPIRNRDGEIIAHAAVHRDISAQRALETQLHHAQRMETAGLLAGGIAHDFNNILTVIQGACNLMAGELDSGNRANSHLALIEQAAERAAGLTRQLLAFSRKQSISPVVLDPNAVIRESANMFARTLGDDIRLETTLDSHWFIREDSTRLEQVLMNLSVNARHAMPQGGTLGISTRDLVLGEQLPPAQAGMLCHTPNAVPAGEYVMISVTDTGCGMDEQTLQRIFDPFFTTKPKGEGTGLGLSVVYGMVVQVGGGISACSAPDRGTHFHLYLPRASGKPQEAVPESPRRQEQEPRGKGRILVVEDDEGVRNLVTALLENAGYQVFQACSPLEVLNGKVETRVDLVLSDVMMPDVSGPEFARKWRENQPDTPFLFMSGFYDEKLHAAGMEGQTLLQKPFKPSELLQSVARMLAAESVRSA